MYLSNVYPLAKKTRDQRQKTNSSSRLDMMPAYLTKGDKHA